MGAISSTGTVRNASSSVGRRIRSLGFNTYSTSGETLPRSRPKTGTVSVKMVVDERHSRVDARAARRGAGHHPLHFGASVRGPDDRRQPSQPAWLAANEVLVFGGDLVIEGHGPYIEVVPYHA